MMIPRRVAPTLPAFQRSAVAITGSARRHAMTRTAARAISGETIFSGAEVTAADRKWIARPLTADEIVRRHQRVLVARARHQCAENDYGRAFLRLCRQNIIGPLDIQLQAQAKTADGKLDAESNQAIEGGWALWGKRGTFEVTGQLSRRRVSNIAVDCLARDGEFMFRIVRGEDAGRWGIAVQVLDPQRCRVDFDAELRDGVFIRHGIEFNQYGKPLAYHFETLDASADTYTYGGRKYVRVPANEVLHGFEVEIVGQKRGLPWMATSLFRLRNLQGFEDAAVQNARAGAAKMGFIKYRDGFGPECEEGENPADAIDAEPLSFHELPEGAELDKFEPNYPNGEFGTFNKAMLRGISAGLGVAYNNFANDLEGVNFSSIRQGSLDEREHWKEKQQTIIEVLHEPLYADHWLPLQLLAGRLVTRGGKVLQALKIDSYREVEWQPRRWSWIDPGADVKAAIDSKNNLMGSYSQFIRDGGRDPETVWAEISADIEAMRAAGIPDDFIKLAMGQKLAPPPDPNAAAANSLQRELDTALLGIAERERVAA